MKLYIHKTDKIFDQDEKVDKNLKKIMDYSSILNQYWTAYILFFAVRFIFVITYYLYNQYVHKIK